MLVAENLFWSLLAGPAVFAALSAATVLQHLLPAWRLGQFPLAGAIGLVCGGLLAVPGARWAARIVNPSRPGIVLLVAVLSGLAWVTPAAIYAPAIGWMGGAVRLYIVAGLLSGSGLIWGGYLNLDAEDGS
jgi:hypothetical protein